MAQKSIVYILILSLAVLLASGCGAQKAEAPKYPTKSVEMIIPWAAGGATDVLFRAVGTVFPKYANNQQIVIKNVPGAGGAQGFMDAMKTKGDGYSIVASATPMISKIHMSSVTFVVNSFAPVIMLADNPCMIMVPADSPYKNLKDLFDDAKKRPGQVTVGNGGSGGGTHLVALALENQIGVKFKHVPFPGGGPSVTALLGKHIDTIMASAPEGIPQAAAGQLRILGIFGEKRLANFPNVPTGKEQGVDFQMTMWRTVLMPKDASPATVAQVHDILKKVLDDPEFIKKAEELSVTLKYMNSADLGKFMQAEDVRYQKLIKDAKLGDRYK
jgi:tripartite-type tricarboxylate transporter receptor subunit TctC